MLRNLISDLKQYGFLYTLAKSFRVLARLMGLTTREQYECVQRQITILREDFTHLRARAIQISQGIDFLAEWHAQHAADLATLLTPSNTHPNFRISIIMPTYNRANLIERALKSVLAQTYPNWELLIIDDGSIDNTAQIIQPYLIDPRVRYLSSPHRGVCAARNIGLRESTGDIIAYLDTDNTWYSHYLHTVATMFEQHPQHHTLYLAYLVEDQVHQHHKVSFLRQFKVETFLEQGGVDMNIFAHRRAVLEQLGGFDEALRYYEDWELVLRYGIKFPPLAVPLIGARYYIGSWKSNSKTENRDLATQYIRQKYQRLISPTTSREVVENV